MKSLKGTLLGILRQHQEHAEQRQEHGRELISSIKAHWQRLPEAERMWAYLRLDRVQQEMLDRILELDPESRMAADIVYLAHQQQNPKIWQELMDAMSFKSGEPQ